MLGDGLSMVYSFFEPDEAARSLGTFMVLDHIARAQRMGLGLRLSRLLGARLAQDGLQEPLPAAGTADAGRLGKSGIKSGIRRGKALRAVLRALGIPATGDRTAAGFAEFVRLRKTLRRQAAGVGAVAAPVGQLLQRSAEYAAGRIASRSGRSWRRRW